MIINFPTGYYKTILPSVPSDVGNITFTISNQSPPRTDLLYPKLPVGLYYKQKINENIDPIFRRSKIGELIYTISSNNRSKTGNNARTFEIGQILEFENSIIDPVDTMLVPKTIEIAHNNNLFDYDSLGLSESEQQEILNSSASVQKILSDSINAIKQRRYDIDIELTSLQKSINEINKNLNALNIINESENSSDIASIIDKMQDKLSSFSKTKEELISEANVLAQQASELRDKLLTVSTVVK